MFNVYVNVYRTIYFFDMYVCVNSISLYLILKQKCFRSHLSLVVNLQTPIKLNETERN